LIVGSEGEPLVASHASKQLGSKGAAAKVRYRYYVSRNLQLAGSSSGAGQRISAPQIEGAVCDRLAEALNDPLGLLAAAGLPLDPGEIRITTSKAPELAAKVRIKNSGLIRALVAQVQVLRKENRIDLQLPKLVTMLGVGTPKHLTDAMAITAPVRLTRIGMAMRLIQSNGKAVVARQPDPKIVRLLLQAKAWWSRLADGSIDITNLAREQGINDSWVTRIVRLNFLAPSLVEAILAGDQQAVPNFDTLLTSGPLPLDWRDQ
jgi:site-specific DNA recombinase